MTKTPDLSTTLARGAAEAREILGHTAQVLEGEWQRLLRSLESSEFVPEPVKQQLGQAANRDLAGDLAGAAHDVRAFMSGMASAMVRTAAQAGLPIPAIIPIPSEDTANSTAPDGTAPKDTAPDDTAPHGVAGQPTSVPSAPKEPAKAATAKAPVVGAATGKAAGSKVGAARKSAATKATATRKAAGRTAGTTKAATAKKATATRKAATATTRKVANKAAAARATRPAPVKGDPETA